MVDRLRPLELRTLWLSRACLANGRFDVADYLRGGVHPKAHIEAQVTSKFAEV